VALALGVLESMSIRPEEEEEEEKEGEVEEEDRLSVSTSPMISLACCGYRDRKVDMACTSWWFGADSRASFRSNSRVIGGSLQTCVSV
jgi:hypothetical protein